MKKILYYVEAMGGGVFTYMVDLVNQICNKYEIYVAYGLRPQTPINYIEYFDRNIHLIEVKNFTRSINIVEDLKAFHEIRRIANSIKPDIIHLHSSKAGVLGRWAFNGRKVKMFYTPHGYSFMMQDCIWIKRIAFKAIEYLSSKRYCTTISCSQGEHNETLKFTKKATFVSNGININELNNIMKNYLPSSKKQTFTVFTLGRICYQKNPKLFNDIAERLPDIKFIWIGDGELRETLKSKNIEVTGWLDREKAIKYSINADLFLLTSLWEGLPISLLEAMYLKKICVVSNVIGNNDVIKNCINGFICNDMNGFVNVIRQVSTIYNNNITNNAYQNILTEYNNLIMGCKYKAIYEQ